MGFPDAQSREHDGDGDPQDGEDLSRLRGLAYAREAATVRTRGIARAQRDPLLVGASALL